MNDFRQEATLFHSNSTAPCASELPGSSFTCSSPETRRLVLLTPAAPFAVLFALTAGVRERRIRHGLSGPKSGRMRACGLRPLGKGGFHMISRRSALYWLGCPGAEQVPSIHFPHSQKTCHPEMGRA